MTKYLFLFLFFPFTLLSQNVVVVSLSPVLKHHHSEDSIKSISYPVIKCQPAGLCDKINKAIKAKAFYDENYDTSKSLENLLKAIYKKEQTYRMWYTINRNQNGLLSLTITKVPSQGERTPPLYLNFDLNTGNTISLSDMMKTKNDSFSFREAVVPIITDSIRLFEQTINKSNPKYSDIIEWLNTTVSSFSQSYPLDYIMTDREIVVYFDCFMPTSLLLYNHTYRLSFPYRTFKHIFKPDMVKRLE